MITVKFYSQAGLLVGFSLDGHAGRGEEGEDLLCASVSSAAYMTANTITDVLHIQTDLEVGEGHMRLLLSPEEAQRAQALFKGFGLHLASLAEDYPENVKVKYGGVRNA